MSRKRQPGAPGDPPPKKPAAKKPTPHGTDHALALPTPHGPLALTYWDLWFALVAAEHDGDLPRLAEDLTHQERRLSFGRDSAKHWSIAPSRSASAPWP
jgi:hypothetical protein